MQFRKHTLAMLVVLTSYSHGSPVGAASFDCEKTDLAADEKAICDDRVLNDKDVRMATTFDIVTQLMAMGARDALKTAQSEWLQQRQTCEADIACLNKAYDERMTKLDEAFQQIDRPL